LLVACVIVSGCSFAIEPQPPGIGGEVQPDAPATMPDAAIDAPPDAPPVWTIIETLTIETYDSGLTPAIAQSAQPLPAGAAYRVRLSGEFRATTGGAWGDAEYYELTGTATDFATGVDIGVGIDDVTVDGTKTRWGAYTPTHTYEIDYTGTGARLQAVLYDSQYNNNYGTLRLDILALQ
jgi:hypothetical protein